MEGLCDACDQWGAGVHLDYSFICDSCASSARRRCLTYALVYDHDTLELLGRGHSREGRGSCCAERNALFRLAHNNRPKLLTVYRVYRNGNKQKFHVSKPCASCIITMQLSNVKTVGYSTSGNQLVFEWESVDCLENDRLTTCNVVLKL